MPKPTPMPSAAGPPTRSHAHDRSGRRPVRRLGYDDAVGVATTQSFERLGRATRRVEPAGDGLVGRQSLYRYEGRRVRVRVRPRSRGQVLY